MNYYNDNDSKNAAWLRELIKQNVIPPGDVDERSIVDVTKSDLTGYNQCHFFAGIGGWAEALRIAGIGSNTSLWTGSCPCQPFSCAGQGKGEKDERHLWPEFYRLVRECKPPLVFGEQVESAEVVGTKLEADFIIAVQRGDFARANKLAKQLVKSKSFHYHKRWLDGVRSDLEREGYSFRFTILGAHSVGAPHIRQRLYWVANSERTERGSELQPNEQYRDDAGWDEEASRARACGKDGGMEYPESDGRGSRRSEPDGRKFTSGCSKSGMEYSNCTGLEQQRRSESIQPEYASVECGSNPNFWSNSIWIPCADGKARRIEPEIFPLVNGLPGRVGLLRGSGNAIVPEVAAEFIKAYFECRS